jgi:hypothetical protein
VKMIADTFRHDRPFEVHIDKNESKG